MKKLPSRPLAAVTSAIPALFAATSHAQEAVAIGQIDQADSGDTAWILTATALILLSGITGLYFSFAGRLGPRSAQSTLLQTISIVAAVSTLWVVVGYTLAFGLPSGGVVGAGNAWMMIGLGSVREGLAIPESAFAFFQIAFAAFGAVMLTGAWAGRARFGWALGTAALWSLVVYAPVSHWVWGGGWLAYKGVLDFSGGLVLHFTAGVSALTATIMVGRRHHTDNTSDEATRPALCLAGAGTLWVAWIGFAGGSALTANDNAATAIINAHVAASISGLVWLALTRFKTGAISLTGLAKGIISGLVAISAAAGYVSPGGAFVIGVVAAPVCYFAAALLRDVLGVDDTSDIFALHGVGGLVGSLLAAIFISPSLGGTGYLEGMGMLSQLVSQLIGMAAVGIWAVVATTIIGLGVSIIIPMRISSTEELDAACRDDYGHDMMPAE